MEHVTISIEPSANNPAVTERQLDILKHAIAWPKRYRNHFCTGPGSEDYEDCIALVGAGLMACRQVEWIPDDLFTVTPKGIEFVEEQDLGPSNSKGRSQRAA